MSKIVRITCAIVDKTHLTMYKEDGSTIIINQGDVRMKRIVDSIGPQLLANGYADVDLSGPPVQNSYKDFEEKSSGVIKLFRIAKTKLANFFRTDDLVAEIVDPIQLGQVPNATQSKALADFQKVMQHATPVAAESFSEDSVAKQGVVRDEAGRSSSYEESDAKTSKDTIIAVVGNKIVPGVEKIKSQFAYASKNGTAAVEAFLARVAGISRKHSVEDLLKFMERGDLPIAEDGSIIIYKLLKTRGSDESVFYDVHSGNVPQKVGSYVCMDEKMVDHNRHTECSNGLHVARRGYLGSFSGNIMVLAKVAPEDVIAVPHGDANKMRVCGYHIIMRLPENLKKLLQSNNPMTGEPEGRSLLAAAIAGKHIGRVEEVRIGGAKGTNIVVTQLEAATPVLQSELATLLTPEKMEAAVALEADKGIKEVAPNIDPNEVAKEVKAILSRKEQAKVLYDNLATGGQEALDAIHAFKKASKTSWEKLGLPDINGPVISLREVKPTKVKADKLKPTKQVHAVDFGDEPKDRTSDDDFFTELTKVVKVKVKPSRVTGTVLPKAEYKGGPAGKPVTDLHSGKQIGVLAGSARERIQKYLSIGVTTKAQAEQIISIKRAAKKSWEVLGVSNTELHIINLLAGK